MLGILKKKQAQAAQSSEEKEIPGIYPGMLLEVLTRENQLIFVGRIDWIKGDTIQISDKNESSLPYIEFKSDVKLRGFSKSQSVTLEGIVGANSSSFWRIEQLRSIQQSERRANFRQNANLDAKVMCVNEIFGSPSAGAKRNGTSFACSLLDISASGARIRTEGVFVEGDWLFLMDVKVIPDEPTFTFTCVVRRVIERGKASIYGCEFYQLESREQERLVRGILAIQRKELQARRGTR